MSTATHEHSESARSSGPSAPTGRETEPAAGIKLAIVHDVLNEAGGAESVLAVMHRMYPTAPIFTPVFHPDKLPEAFRGMDVRTSFMQRLPILGEDHHKHMAMYPSAMESFDLSGFDVVLSSSSAFAKGVRIPRGTLHICYCYTPIPLVWNRQAYFREHGIRPAWRPVPAVETGSAEDVGRAYYRERRPLRRDLRVRRRPNFRRLSPRGRGDLPAGRDHALFRVARSGRLLPRRVAADRAQQHRSS